jgi:hypothetical protein
MLRFYVGFAVALSMVACSGGTADLGGKSTPIEEGNAGEDASTSSSSSSGSSGTPGSSETEADAGQCSFVSHPRLVVSGGTLTPRPTEKELRVTIAYQGSRVAIIAAKGVDSLPDTGSSPLTPGVNSGHWFEIRDATNALLYTHLFQDPTSQEVFGPNGQLPIPFCDEKQFELRMPNDSAGKDLVLYGSPYGTSQVASELARFHLP